MEVQKLRAQYTEVKGRLPNLQISYAMLYLAKLRIVAKGETLFLTLEWLSHGWTRINIILYFSLLQQCTHLMLYYYSELKLPL